MTVPDPLDALERETREVVAALDGCQTMVGTSGASGVATHLRGRRVPGVRIDDQEIEVHVVARWGIPLAELDRDVRRALSPVAHGRVISIFVDDVELPSDVPVA